MAKKSARDPVAPKRNMSAYLLYQNAMRDQFRALNPGMTFGQLAKYTSAMYAEMPPGEKEAWIQRAEADKARYLHELASYVPSPGYDAKGDAILTMPQAGDPAVATTTRRSKPEKDANAPKRNMSAYLLYQNSMRDQFKRDNPGMTFGQLAKYTSHMYRNLTPEEKQTWDDRASADKARYEAQLSAYKPPPGHDPRGNMVSSAKPRKRSKRTPKDPNAPKRASGAYVFFTNEMRPVVMREYPGIKFVEMGRLLGERWRALSPHQKKRYDEMAAEDKVRFQMEMQAYTANGAAGVVSAMPPQPHVPPPVPSHAAHAALPPVAPPAPAPVPSIPQHHYQQYEQQQQQQLYEQQQQAQAQAQAQQQQQHYYHQGQGY